MTIKMCWCGGIAAVATICVFNAHRFAADIRHPVFPAIPKLICHRPTSIGHIKLGYAEMEKNTTFVTRMPMHEYACRLVFAVCCGLERHERFVPPPGPSVTHTDTPITGIDNVVGKLGN